MAVTRTILPRKGLVQPQHGLTGYEADQDANWLLLDTNVAFLWEVPPPGAGDLEITGVVSGSPLSAAPSLTPGLAGGVLFAQGNRSPPASAPVPPAAPANAANYLFYNSA